MRSPVGLIWLLGRVFDSRGLNERFIYFGITIEMLLTQNIQEEIFLFAASYINGFTAVAACVCCVCLQ